MFSPEKLHAFITVVNYMNVTKAAEHLFISQPTLSKYISALEKELGATLLIRKNKHIKLTPAGEYLYRMGPQLLTDMDAIESDIRHLAENQAESLSLIRSSFAQYSNEFSEIAAELIGRYSIEISLSLAPFDRLMNIMYTKSADIAIVGFPFSDKEHFMNNISSKFHIMEIYHDKFYLAVSANHPFAEKESVSIDDLSKTKLVLPAARLELPRDFLYLMETTMTNVTYKQSFEELQFSVKTGQAAAFLDGHSQTSFKELKFIPVETEKLNFGVGLLWNKENLNSSIKLFLDVAKEKYPDHKMIL